MSYIIRLYKTVSILSAKIIMIMGLFVGWGLVFEGNACAQGQPLLYTVPFKAGDSGYLIFRIPAIWAAPNKPLMAFAEGRVSKRKAMGNIDIVLRRSLDLGQTWEPLQVVADFGDDFCGNPCVVQDPTNSRLWLSFTRSPGAATEEQIVERKMIRLRSGLLTVMTMVQHGQNRLTCHRPAENLHGVGMVLVRGWGSLLALLKKGV